MPPLQNSATGRGCACDHHEVDRLMRASPAAAGERGAEIRRELTRAHSDDAAMDRQFRYADGRLVTYREYGAPGGFPVLALHGTPGSRLKYAAAHADAARMGLRVISPDRWGYGRSDPHPEPALADYARDAAELLHGLNIGRFSVVGISGGGPYAVAVAAQLRERVRSLALVAPIGPISGRLGPRDLRLFHQICFPALARAPRIVGLVFTVDHVLLN